MIKTKFSIQLHILTLLALYKDDWLTSSLISSSLNVNAVLVRKELSILKEGGLLESKEGKNGGVRILKDPQKILLSDIFLLAKGDQHILSNLKNEPNPKCKVGKKINNELNFLMDRIDDSVIKELSTITLENFKNKF